MTRKTVRLTSICCLFLPRSPNILSDCTCVVVVKIINNMPLALVVIIVSVFAFFLFRNDTSVDAMQYVGKMGMKDGNVVVVESPKTTRCLYLLPTAPTFSTTNKVI